MSKKKKIITISLIVLVSSLATLFILTRPPKFNLDKLNLALGDSELTRLEKFKDEAIEKGYLDRSPDDYVPANFSYNNKPFTGKVRLKGDLLDHLKENKWSFRIKLDNPMNDGLQVFSVQSPESRGFLNGYMYHQLLKEEGVLTNEFRFIELIVNDKSWGIYCLEEHLTSRMISSQNRPNGVLLKFTDNAFFSAKEGESTDGLIKKAKIKVYGTAKKDERFKHDIILAKRIIKDYQYGIDSAYNDFNAKQTGLYYALCDLGTAYHAMGWINVRFYFNFDTQKMELVGYDGYPVLQWGKPYLGKHANTLKLDPFETKMIVYNALKNDAINKVYFKALQRVSQPNYVKKLMDKHHSQLIFLEAEIQKEYNYEYDYQFLIERGKEIQTALNLSSK